MKDENRHNSKGLEGCGEVLVVKQREIKNVFISALSHYIANAAVLNVPQSSIETLRQKLQWEVSLRNFQCEILV